MPPNARSILSYSLFGESDHLPDVMHCETIAARSVLHDWELAPHRHARLHQLLFLRAGAGQVHLEGAARELTAMALVNVPVGEVHAFAFVPGTQGWVVTLADEMLDEILSGVGDVRRELNQAAVIHAGEPEARLMEQIWAEFGGCSSARALVLRGLCTALLGLVVRRLEGAAQGDAEVLESRLFRRFEALVEAHFPEHWKVADYARALAVTPTHLSRVARAVSGEPASHLIETRLLREARRKLAYTSLRVSSIAYELGFSDPGHFTRMFSRATGVSPRDFRGQLAR